jgi:hypothetical protein
MYNPCPEGPSASRKQLPWGDSPLRRETIVRLADVLDVEPKEVFGLLTAAGSNGPVMVRLLEEVRTLEGGFRRLRRQLAENAR